MLPIVLTTTTLGIIKVVLSIRLHVLPQVAVGRGLSYSLPGIFLLVAWGLGWGLTVLP